MAIDPAAAERVRNMWLAIKPPPDQPVEARRAQIDAMYSTFAVPGDIEVEALDADGVPCEWARAPGTDPDRSILYYHGGGHAVGSPRLYRELAYRLSRAANARVLLVDFRLLPEHTYADVLVDSVTAYRWLVRRMDPERIVVVGDSAGGGLAMAVNLTLRDSRERLPAGIALISPLVDLAAEGGSYETNADLDVVISRARVLGTRTATIGQGRPEDFPLASPLHADLDGLPPLFVTVGGHEVLRDDAVRLVKRVSATGGQAEVKIVDEMQHIFPIFASLLPEGQTAIEKIGSFAQRCVAVALEDDRTGMEGVR